MVYLKSVENVITLGKLIGLLFLFCLPLLSILFLKTKRNDLARPVMGTIFLVYRGIFTAIKFSKTFMAFSGFSNHLRPKNIPCPPLFISPTLEYIAKLLAWGSVPI